MGPFALAAVAACSVADDRSSAPPAAHAAESSSAGPSPTPAVPASTTAPVSAASSMEAPPFTPPSLSGIPSAVGSPSAIAVASTGSAAAGEPPPPCPDDMVLVGRFCVDRFEAFLKERSPDGRLVNHPYYERPVKGVTYVAANEKGAFPQGYISRVESKAACAEAGKRLCSKGEWQRACRGKGFATYPYGQRAKKGACNSGKIHLLSQMFKHPTGGFKYEDHFNSPELNKTAGFLAKAGEYDECGTELGVFDMVGNLHEWVSDNVDEDLMQKLEEEKVERRKQPWQVGNGVFMGGFYSTTSEHGPGCSFITVAHEPSYHDYSTGFRCCKAADLPKPPPKVAGKPKPKRQ